MKTFPVGKLVCILYEGERESIYVCVYVCVYMCVCTSMFAEVCMCVRTYMFAEVCVCVCTLVCVLVVMGFLKLTEAHVLTDCEESKHAAKACAGGSRAAIDIYT